MFVLLTINTIKVKNISNKKLLIVFVILLVLNIICLIFLTQKVGVSNLDGSYSQANSTGLIISVLSGIIISFPIACAILAAIIACFVNRQDAYGKRFLQTFLVTLVIVYAIFFLRLVFNIISQ